MMGSVDNYILMCSLTTDGWASADKPIEQTLERYRQEKRRLTSPKIRLQAQVSVQQ